MATLSNPRRYRMSLTKQQVGYGEWLRLMLVIERALRSLAFAANTATLSQTAALAAARGV